MLSYIEISSALSQEEAMAGPYKADAIANEFLNDRLEEDITPMKIQKLVYYAHAWSLALFDEPLISDRIEAWEYGPVVPALYSEFREFRNQPIRRLACELDFENLREVPDRIDPEDDRTKQLVDRIWQKLGHFTATQLSNLTHSPNEPWFQIPKKRPGLAIPDALIQKCFKKMIEEND